MNPAKQQLFMSRVLFLHQLAVKRVSVQTTSAVRLSSQSWESEVEMACLGEWVFAKMEQELDSEGVRVFTPKVIDNCRARFIEGYLI